ncbi:hypothetical protein [Sedimentibacter sp.]|uniref:hypothetical protein n=1 Tax=Sedimentibacter sp. TaxID=1960295 RepID=UPI0028B089D2|nr:hypothetical protein [Sedimentibacter sp.]
MLKLSNECFNKVSYLLKNEARDLEKYLYEYHFQGGSSKNIIKELKKYQNDDGGFGKALESDFRQPDSSPMATSIGIRILSEIEETEDTKNIIKSACKYFELTFNEKRSGWYALNKEVNKYPHAPWWHYDVEKGMTVIDKNWGNPSAEILAYLYKYRNYTNLLDINYLIEYAIKYIEDKKVFESDNELFCYIKLFEILPEDIKSQLKNRISCGISQVIEYNRENWKDYVPLPLDFVSSPEKEKFGVINSKINENLDYYVELIEGNEGSLINPPWGDSYYQGSLKPAYNEWKGVLTLKILKRLDNYNRIER